MKRVFVIGSVNTDFVIHAPYVPKKGETLTGGGFFTARGGKGANQAIAASRSGADVVMCACVGEDSFGEEALEAFRKEGIDVSFVRKVPSAPTGTAMITVVDGDNRIILDPGANACLTREDVDAALRSAMSGDVLLAQLENPPEVIGYALKRAKEKNMTVVLNPAPADPAILPFLSACDLVVPNETEAEILGGREELAKTVGTLIVTVGGDGFELYRKGEKTRFPCMDVKVVDTTAAGDTFCGSLCARLALGEDTEKAARYGGAAASLACTKKGAQPSIPSSEEVSAFLGRAEEG